MKPNIRAAFSEVILRRSGSGTPANMRSRNSRDFGHVIECPLHFATFDVRTGKLLSGPASADVVTYEVRIEGDTVYVKR